MLIELLANDDDTNNDDYEENARNKEVR